MAFQTPITIEEAVENINRGKYLLPAIQRDLVWNTDQIERLFDSLMRELSNWLIFVLVCRER